MNLFDLTLRISGFNISSAKKVLGDIQLIPERDYEAYVKDQRKNIVDHHLNNNKIYRSLVGKDRFNVWEDLPVMKKSDLQKPLKDRLSVGYTAKKVYVNKTSGSSGHPFVFAKDTFCHALTWAEIMDRFGWFGINFNSSLQARFYGIPLDRIGYQKEKTKGSPKSQISISYIRSIR